MDEARLRAIEERSVRALALVDALCTPEGTPGARRWAMSIPARPDHDPDLVIGEALMDVAPLVAAYRAQRDEVAVLKLERANFRRLLDGVIEVLASVVEPAGEKDAQ